MPARPRRCAAMAAFSTTLIPASRCACWKVRAMPRAAMRLDPSRSMRCPAKTILPPFTGSTPEMRLKVVVLPAPLGPMRPRISPAASEKVSSFTATRPPNLRLTARTSSSGAVSAGRARGAAASADVSMRGRRGAKNPASAGAMPSRARCMMSMSRMPSTTISKLPARPRTFGRKSCSHCLSSVSTVAPITVPHTYPAPPSTVMNRYSMPA